MGAGECLYGTPSNSVRTHQGHSSIPEARDPHGGAGRPSSHTPGLRHSPAIFRVTHTMAPTPSAHLRPSGTHSQPSTQNANPLMGWLLSHGSADIRTRVHTRQTVHLHACTLLHICTHPRGRTHAHSTTTSAPAVRPALGPNALTPLTTTRSPRGPRQSFVPGKGPAPRAYPLGRGAGAPPPSPG